MKKQTQKEGYTFRDPSGALDCILCSDKDTARENAAFASDRRYNHIVMPDDWRRAYRQGFRVVPVTMRAAK